MGSFFNFNDIIGHEAKSCNDDLQVMKFEKLHLEYLSSLKKLVNRLPNDNEAFFIETYKSFNAFTFIVLLYKELGRIDELNIASYSINTRIINALVKTMEKGFVGHTHIYINETIKQRNPTA